MKCREIILLKREYAMRQRLSEAIELCRLQGGSGSGCYGTFLLVCPVTNRTLYVIASDGRDWHTAEEDLDLPGEPWEHISASVRDPDALVGRRVAPETPTWEEMCWLKDAFWDADECVIQFHPPRSEYVNAHQTCLHLWKPPYPTPCPPRATLV